MAYAKITRRLRSITVQGTKFRWRFSPKEHHSILAIYGSNSGCQPLLVTLRGWQDPWIAFPFAAGNEPKLIGPKFVSQAIAFGLENGWLPQQSKAPLLVNFENGIFYVGNESSA